MDNNNKNNPFSQSESGAPETNNTDLGSAFSQTSTPAAPPQSVDSQNQMPTGQAQALFPNAAPSASPTDSVNASAPKHNFFNELAAAGRNNQGTDQFSNLSTAQPAGQASIQPNGLYQNQSQSAGQNANNGAKPASKFNLKLALSIGIPVVVVAIGLIAFNAIYQKPEKVFSDALYSFLGQKDYNIDFDASISGDSKGTYNGNISYDGTKKLAKINIKGTAEESKKNTDMGTVDAIIDRNSTIAYVNYQPSSDIQKIMSQHKLTLDKSSYIKIDRTGLKNIYSGIGSSFSGLSSSLSDTDSVESTDSTDIDIMKLPGTTTTSAGQVAGASTDESSTDGGAVYDKLKKYGQCAVKAQDSLQADAKQKREIVKALIDSGYVTVDKSKAKHSFSEVAYDVKINSSKKKAASKALEKTIYYKAMDKCEEQLKDSDDDSDSASNYGIKAGEGVKIQVSDADDDEEDNDSSTSSSSSSITDTKITDQIDNASLTITASKLGHKLISLSGDVTTGSGSNAEKTNIKLTNSSKKPEISIPDNTTTPTVNKVKTFVQQATAIIFELMSSSLSNSSN